MTTLRAERVPVSTHDPRTVMPMSGKSESAPAPIAPALTQVQAQLGEQLQKVCETAETQRETAGELLRLEDELLKAAHAAKEAAELRQRMDHQTRAGTDPRRPREEAPRPHTGVREFQDSDGSAWRVWAVVPRPRGDKLSLYLGDFQKGWLAFESLTGGRRKRLPQHPPDWLEWDDAALQGLLSLAAEVTERRREPRAPQGPQLRHD